MGFRCPRSHFTGLMRLMIGLSALTALPGGFGRAALAASPRDQAYLACANGYEGNAGDCARICRRFLKQRSPLGDMRATCVSRTGAGGSKGVPEPD